LRDGPRPAADRHHPARHGALPSLLIHYHETPITVVNNGHTIQVDYAPGSSIDIERTTYQLIQFHFIRQ
jgi:carbonic anhydrase